MLSHEPPRRDPDPVTVPSAEYEANEQSQPTLLDLGEAAAERRVHRGHLRGKSGEVRNPRDLPVPSASV